MKDVQDFVISIIIFIVYSNSGHKIYRTKCMIPRICYCGIESGCKLIVSKSKTELLADK